jgi:hypothetical protein
MMTSLMRKPVSLEHLKRRSETSYMVMVLERIPAIADLMEAALNIGFCGELASRQPFSLRP